MFFEVEEKPRLTDSLVSGGVPEQGAICLTHERTPEMVYSNDLSAVGNAMI